jgi:aspartate aminotransferase
MQKLVAGSSLIRAMFEESKKMAVKYGEENVFDYSLGNPSFPPPAAVNESIRKWLDCENQVFVHGYMNNSGYPEVREKIAAYLNGLHGTDFTAENLFMTVGAAGGLNTVLKTLIDPGDEVLTFAPYFGEYDNYAANVGAPLIPVPAQPPRFGPNLEAFEKIVSAKTKVVIINSPNNPTGVIYSEEELKGIAEILEKKQKEFGTDIYILSDEPYRELVYTDKKVPYVTKFYSNTIVGYSFSKSLSLAGERIGFVVVPKEAADSENIIAAANVLTRTLGYVNSPSLMQLVVADCIEEKVDIDSYKKNRDTLYTGLTEIGYECVEPEGAFYLFVKAPTEDDLEFAGRAKEHQIALTPGRVFGAPGYFRLAYCTTYDKVERSLPQFAKLYDSYK